MRGLRVTRTPINRSPMANPWNFLGGEWHNLPVRPEFVPQPYHLFTVLDIVTILTDVFEIIPVQGYVWIVYILWRNVFLVMHYKA